ncbi:hypothetical protein MASR2M54_06820 [Aliarcobacter cryaerophilus]
MKKILIILDGIVAKKLLQRIVESNTGDNNYDVVYMNDVILPFKNRQILHSINLILLQIQNYQWFLTKISIVKF